MVRGPLTENPDWMPHGVDEIVPNPARMYDYWLGGSHNFASDRALANQIQQAVPAVRDAVRVNRAFLRRAVLFMVDSGVRQFLDIGSGIPTVGNVHEIAQRADPECRVVYVDKESVAVAHSELLLADNDRAAVIQANLCEVAGVLDHPQTQRVLNFDQPIGLLMLLLVHFVPDSWDPASILASYRDRLAPGSYLALTHLTGDDNPTGMTEATQFYQTTTEPLHPRSREEVLGLFAGYELVDPGLVGCALWRPSGLGDTSDDAEMNTVFCGGVGRKP